MLTLLTNCFIITKFYLFLMANFLSKQLSNSSVFTDQVLAFYPYYFSFSVLLHLVPKIKFLENLFFIFIPLFRLVLSPDYEIANSFKETFSTEEKNTISKPVETITISSTLYDKFEKKKSTIITWNIYNLLVSIISLVFLFNYSIKDSTNLKNIFTLFFFCRCVSRSFEIIFAFFKDIVDDDVKNPLLKPKIRIILAINSLLETIINFSIFYFLDNLPSTSLKDSFLYSFGMSTSTAATLNSLMSILQIITTLTIIIFAFAGYLNYKNYNVEKK